MKQFFKIAEPCSVAWSDMKGSKKIRHCELCNKSVHNVCNMSKTDMKDLLATYRGADRVCIYIPPSFVKRVGYFFGAIILSIFFLRKPIFTKLFGYAEYNGHAGGMMIDESKFTNFTDFTDQHDSKDQK